MQMPDGCYKIIPTDAYDGSKNDAGDQDWAYFSMVLQDSDEPLHWSLVLI